MSTKNWGYCDLSISKSYDLKKINFIEKLGYRTIAVNTSFEETNDEPKKKKKKGESREKQDFIPAPAEVPQDITNNSKLNILQRLTIEFSDSSIAHKLNSSENLKKYDIIAVIPKTIQAFQYACGAMDIDIITFEPDGRMPFKISRKLYMQAVDRGIFFELMYSPAIRDSTARKNIISTAHMYHAIGKSRNLVVTSAAEDYTHVRGIHDVVNLGFLLGLDNSKSLEVIRNNPRQLILKAEGRRCGKPYMKVSTEQIDLSENKITEL